MYAADCMSTDALLSKQLSHYTANHVTALSYTCCLGITFIDTLIKNNMVLEVMQILICLFCTMYAQ